MGVYPRRLRMLIGPACAYIETKLKRTVGLEGGMFHLDFREIFVAERDGVPGIGQQLLSAI